MTLENETLIKNEIKKYNNLLSSVDYDKIYEDDNLIFKSCMAVVRTLEILLISKVLSRKEEQVLDKFNFLDKNLNYICNKYK